MRRKKTKLKAFVLQNSTLDRIPADISDAIKGRRSVGTFKDKRVSTEIIDKLVDAARRHFYLATFNPGRQSSFEMRSPKRNLQGAALDQEVTAAIDN